MPRPSSAQPRRPAGVPAGGQFAPTSRPAPSGIRLVEDEPAASEQHQISEALLEIDALGADNAERMVQVGHVAAALPAAARSVVGEALDASWQSRVDDHDKLVGELAGYALYRATLHAGVDDGDLDGVLSGLSRQAMRTDLERAARHHVRQALRVEDEGDTSWLCPADPAHETIDGRCTTCGATGTTNEASAEAVPAVDEPEEGPAPARPGLIDPADIDLAPSGNPWASGGEDAQLVGTIQVGSTPFHVLALQVEEAEVQRSLQRDEDLGAVMETLGDQGPYETVEIEGRSYVLLISPYQR